MNNLFDKVFSVDEIKISVLVIVLTLSSTFGLVMYVIEGDITDNLLSLLSTLIYEITGINAINITKEVFNDFKNSKIKDNIDSPI
ncbi:hypothetical protein [Chengkuizengella sediminis]|uniref:hypothetical protein n=1 Tax=Chengkuizengella sediminis TaxID=1885917 RepID=UPI00138A0FA7|nr:hypothetical protein [Chengkuizengella sediminis]NDI33237.1 hypothetical protein [Chengkuizengella sediminis]